MTATFEQPDGLYLSTGATLAQLLEDETLAAFAAGILHAALTTTCYLLPATCCISLAETLHYTGGPESYPLLTALLTLDAEVHAQIGEDRRVLPLPGFLSYRASLPPERAPLAALRLPPLNVGGRYHFAVTEGESWLAARLDLHETLRVAGHVRLALSSPTRPPQRLQSIEERLDRQIMSQTVLETALAAGTVDLASPLTQAEQTTLLAVLNGLIA
ncbi:MAG: hypothetical protein DPW09_00725 [Anaerolineae bacterium]|nr:hypothetical protein [Anaerolineales bacterium]MCQ3971948.1 hypothetical protein [Anaerolineae bacterium]